MAHPIIAVVLAIASTTSTLGRKTGTSGRYDKEEVFFPMISTNFLEKFSFNSFPEIRVRMSKEICGQPHPECNRECFDTRGFCNCRNKYGHFFRCKDYGKNCTVGEHESFDYSKIHPQHSAAMPPKREYTYLRQGVTDEEKQQILEIHNNYRSKVARGKELRSPEQGVSQPSGSNIKELIWNDELAYIAQMLWASTYEIGCGAAYYQGGYYKIGSATIYVCNYGPGGNTVGLEMYAIGRPASKCGESGKSAKYKGLCASKP